MLHNETEGLRALNLTSGGCAQLDITLLAV